MSIILSLMNLNRMPRCFRDRDRFRVPSQSYVLCTNEHDTSESKFSEESLVVFGFVCLAEFNKKAKSFSFILTL